MTVTSGITRHHLRTAGVVSLNGRLGCVTTFSQLSRHRQVVLRHRILTFVSNWTSSGHLNRPGNVRGGSVTAQAFELRSGALSHCVSSAVCLSLVSFLQQT
jgi:hypothetical protein